MNMALTLNENGQAMLVYDRPLGFIPSWVEVAQDGRGLRIISEEGMEYVAGHLDQAIFSRLRHLDVIFLMRTGETAPGESFRLSFISQD